MAKNKLSVDELMSLPDAQDEGAIVEIPGHGVVVVKPLSLAEHRKMQSECNQGDKFDETRWYTLLLMYGLKEPKLEYDQAAGLADKRVGLVNLILAAILEASGLVGTGGISKEAVDESEENFRSE
jgi:hypothetical protein